MYCNPTDFATRGFLSVNSIEKLKALAVWTFSHTSMESIPTMENGRFRVWGLFRARLLVS